MTLVSVIVPCYNEQATICLLLDALYYQTYPLADLEIVVADGMSTDRTIEQIRNFQTENPELTIRVIFNKEHSIPAGLNKAILAANGEYIIRLDAHSMPDRDYISRCVADLQRGLGDNVGGVWEIRPGGQGWVSKSIALAASHPLAVGDARYRYSDRAGSTDTVPFGAFQRALIQKIGDFNEELLTNEDYEFNARVRQAGGTVWLDPEIRSVYFARPTFLALARQYGRYGFWKVRMLRKYPKTIRWRQALPPLFVASLLVLGLLAIWLPVARWLILLELAIYCTILGWVGIRLAIKRADARLAVGIPLAIIVMHLSWGSAFLWSLVR
jgi:succinoglycan biosynthesis protein ExoA